MLAPVRARMKIPNEYGQVSGCEIGLYDRFSLPMATILPGNLVNALAIFGVGAMDISGTRATRQDLAAGAKMNWVALKEMIRWDIHQFEPGSDSGGAFHADPQLRPNWFPPDWTNDRLRCSLGRRRYGAALSCGPVADFRTPRIGRRSVWRSSHSDL